MQVEEVASNAVGFIIKESVMGALLVVAVALLVWLVKRVLAIQDLRVEDQKKMSERLEKASDKQAALITTMTETFTAFKVTLEKLNNTWELNEKATSSLSSSVDKLQNTVDSVVRDAVRGQTRRGYSGRTTPPPEAPQGGG